MASELQEKTDHLFIYGISRLSVICRRQLEEAGIDFQGHVVSDGQMKPEEIEGKKVYHLQEVLLKNRKSGFVLAVQPVNADVIVAYLKRYGVENYCEPYTIL